jgi:predicted nucleic-acid-binding Zn-ribbon protein
MAKRKGHGSGRTEDILARKFVCPKCDNRGADAERLTMSGTGFSRFFDIQPYRYAFVSCNNCGYTEIYNLRTLEGKDNLGTFVDILFSAD